MLIKTIQDDNLWAKINNTMDLDTLVVKPFWHRYATTIRFDRTAIFRFKLACLMEYMINKGMSIKECLALPLAYHPWYGPVPTPLAEVSIFVDPEEVEPAAGLSTSALSDINRLEQLDNELHEATRFDFIDTV